MARAPDERYNQARVMYLEGQKLVEIASQLNLPEGTVRRWKSTHNWDSERSDKNSERSERKNKQKKKVVEDEVKQVMDNPELTEKQRLFCVYYVRSFNATKAYRKAYGCDEYTARVNASRMLTNANIRDEIQKLKKNRLNREFLSEDDIFQKYMDIAFADITDFVEFGRETVPVMGAFGPVQVKDEETGKKETLMQEVNVVRLKESKGVDGTLIAEVKHGKSGSSIKLADRMKALQWLTDHMDLATEEQKARIAHIKAKTQGSETEETAEDGFLDALNGSASEDWADEEG